MMAHTSSKLRSIKDTPLHSRTLSPCWSPPRSAGPPGTVHTIYAKSLPSGAVFPPTTRIPNPRAANKAGCSKGIAQEGIQRWLHRASYRERYCNDDQVLGRLLSTCESQTEVDIEIKQRVKSPKIKKALVLYTGGTIGMQPNENGALVPAYKALEARIKLYPELHDLEEYKKLVKFGIIEDSERVMVVKNVRDDISLAYQIYEYQPLLDSSDMSSKDWIKIASHIERFYDNFDGFVILHGTDTLSFTASALSFMLENLSKPVILTGAQVPFADGNVSMIKCISSGEIVLQKSIFESHSDAKCNIVNSLIFASMEQIQEVCVCFANKLMRGNRTVKDSAADLEAFSSPNYPHMAKMKIHIIVYKDLLLKIHRPRCLTLKVHKHLNKNVNLLKMQPLISLDTVTHFLKPPARGLVIETFGSGNVPNMAGLMEALQKAIQCHGIIIVNVTQCNRGSVGALYPMAQILERIGVIAGNDMTAEAALCKLSYVLARHDWTLEHKIHVMKTNICGEMSFPADYFDVHI